MKVHFYSKIDNDLTQYVTDASFKDNVLSFYEEVDKQKNLVNLIIKNTEIELIRDGVIFSSFTFVENKTTPVVYKTQYGDMHFDIFTKQLNVTKNKIFIEYETIFDKKSESNIKLWFIIKENA